MSQSFVILFRQNPPTLTIDEKLLRAEQTASWAAEKNAAGHCLDPHILSPHAVHVGASGVSQSAPEPPVTAILFLEARDLAEASAVAQSHPGLSFRASAEVRPWARPNAPTLE